MPIRVVTWNLKGREAPDLEAVAEVLSELRPDVLALQEVQRGQAIELARRLGWWWTWRFKHWPIVAAPEGLALLAPAPLTGERRLHLAGAARPWSWRRRIAVAGTLVTAEGAITVVGVHLGAGVGDDERARQARLAATLLDGPGCVVGDLNTSPESIVLDAFAAHGLRDAWRNARPGELGATNWGRAPRREAPTKRLDYVLVTAGLAVVAAEVPRHGSAGFERFGRLSDHLPVTVDLAHR